MAKPRGTQINIKEDHWVRTKLADLSHKVVSVSEEVKKPSGEKVTLVNCLCGKHIEHSNVHEQHIRVHHSEACSKCLYKLGIESGMRRVPLR